MLVVRHALNAQGETIADFSWPLARASSLNQERFFDASSCYLIPALIDPHIHGRVPGHEEKEDWAHLARAALAGGFTTLFDMPNTNPSTRSLEDVEQKHRLIQQQLAKVDIPLRYGLYLGASIDHLSAIRESKSHIVGVKIYLGPSTGDLLIPDDESLHRILALSAQENLLVAIHAEDGALMKKRSSLFLGKDPLEHSVWRNPEVAAQAIEKVIYYAKKEGSSVYIAHVSSQAELDLIAQAKSEGVAIYAEASPIHLFLDLLDYLSLGSRAIVNPPLREKKDQEALWKALKSGLIDTIGSDHAPHLLSQKDLPYLQAPAGIPGIETTLPLLFEASLKGLLTLDDIIRLAKSNVEKIFKLTPNKDQVLIDFAQPQTLRQRGFRSKCGWSPFSDRALRGWPQYTTLRGKAYDVQNDL